MSEGLQVQVGTLIGETYRVTHRIGAGGMGEVWGAEHTRLPGLKVAVKLLFGGQVNSEEFSRFQREAHIMAALHHPHITRVIDLNTLADGNPYIVLEFLEGEPLSERLKRGPISLHDTCHILAQVASALKATHAKDIIHRDLKPDNIFLCQGATEGEAHVKVLDFGVSKVRNHDSRLTQHNRGFLGTPHYMSPEQALGEDDVDQAADQFALAIIAYEMISGVLPFDGAQVIQVASKIVNQAPAPLQSLAPHLPVSASHIVHRALSKNKAERFESCERFVSELITAIRSAQPSQDKEDDWGMEALTEVASANSQTAEDLPSPPQGARTLLMSPPKVALSDSLDETVPLAMNADVRRALMQSAETIPMPALGEQSAELKAALEEFTGPKTLMMPTIPDDYVVEERTLVSDPLMQAQLNVGDASYDFIPPPKSRKGVSASAVIIALVITLALASLYLFR